MSLKTTRQVRMYGKYRPARSLFGRNGGKDVPWLNVSGVWLESAGFRIGDRVEIRVADGRLIITNLDGHGDQ